MSSPFSASYGAGAASWTKIPSSQPSPFVPYNPLGVFVIQTGYGDGGYGVLPYGQYTVKVEFVTDWTKVTEPADTFTTVDMPFVPEWTAIP